MSGRQLQKGRPKIYSTFKTNRHAGRWHHRASYGVRKSNGLVASARGFDAYVFYLRALPNVIANNPADADSVSGFLRSRVTADPDFFSAHAYAGGVVLRAALTSVTDSSLRIDTKP